MTLPQFTIRELLNCGVHFGHHPRRWNPKMQPYIFGERNNIHILNLEKTVPLLKRALQAIYDVVRGGGRVLFVGTKRQVGEIIAEHANRSGQYYVNHRWLGGMLTNWKTVSQSIKRLNQYEETLSKGGLALTKKELLKLTREKDKLNQSLGGIREMGGLPNLIFVLDVNKEHLAIQEANLLSIPIVGILDSNSDPQGVDYPIPGNDDAIRAVDFYCRIAADTVLSGMKEQMRSAGLDLGSALHVEDQVDDAMVAGMDLQDHNTSTDAQSAPDAIQEPAQVNA